MDYIGRFEIRNTLGRGAQSVVYLGFDPHLQREVAIKTLRVSTPEESRQLLEEARSVSALRHPGVVPVFEAGEDNGEPHLVFEYVPGMTLAERIEQGPTPPDAAVAIMLPVLDALTHAHNQGLVHRDVKPSNILLSDEQVPRLMDFGIAVRLAARVGSNDPRELAGTPAYMAPEYINERVVRPSIDIFAAGLVLYELLTGTRAVVERDIYRLMYRIAHEDVRLSEDLGIPDRLVDVLHKALARDPSLRWQSAAEFRDALEAAIAPVLEEPAGELQGTALKSTLEFLMRRMRLKSDFPALSGSISAVNRIAGGAETESNAILSGAVLKDVALTNKILKVVNSAMFRQTGGPVSTVSRAVMILGFETVRNLAVALLLFENMQNRGQADALREEFVRAMLAAIMARNLALAAGVRNVEEGFICALFRNLGRLLAQFYFPEEADEVRRLMMYEKLGEEQAANRVLGLGYAVLGMEVARQWGFPDQIVQSQRRLDEGTQRTPADAAERVKMLAALADDMADTVASAQPEQRRQRLAALVERYGKALKVADKQLDTALTQSLEVIHGYASTFNLNLKRTALGECIERWTGKAAPKESSRAAAGSTSASPSMSLANSTLPNGLPEQHIDDTLRVEASGLPDNAAHVLAAGIQDISNTLVGDFKLNDLLRIILETMYRGIGFRRVLLAIKDGRTNTMAGRFGFGPEVNELAQRFRFKLESGQDVFQLVMSRGADLLINDIADPKIAPRIPGWLKDVTRARTFVLFPLLVKDKPVALIYAEHENAGDIVIPERELGLLRTLRNQALLAIKQTL